jgi:hypothetical protein
MDPSRIRAQQLAGPGGQRLSAPPSGPRMQGTFDEVVTPQVEPSAARPSFPRQRPPLAHQILPMVSSSPEEGGVRRHGEKRRTRRAAVSPEPGPTASQVRIPADMQITSPIPFLRIFLIVSYNCTFMRENYSLRGSMHAKDRYMCDLGALLWLC